MQGRQADHTSVLVDSLLADQPVSETDDEQAKRIRRFAVDGALHYAKRLSKEFNVIAVAVSGETTPLPSSPPPPSLSLPPPPPPPRLLYSYPLTFIRKGLIAPSPWSLKPGMGIDRLLPWNITFEHGTFDPNVQRLRFDELMAFARDLHEFMRDHANLQRAKSRFS